MSSVSSGMMTIDLKIDKQNECFSSLNFLQTLLISTPGNILQTLN